MKNSTNISLEALASLLNSKVWKKGEISRIYIDRGYNTKKMSTKTYVYMVGGEIKVSCFVDCYNQPVQWCRSQAAEVIDGVESEIANLIKKSENPEKWNNLPYSKNVRSIIKPTIYNTVVFEKTENQIKEEKEILNTFEIGEKVEHNKFGIGLAMKTVNRNELEKIANTFGAKLNFYPTAELDFGGYGFEATECNIEGDHYAFRFFGNPSKQSELIQVWSLLTDPNVMKPMLTVEAAKALIGKTVRVSYCDYNNGEEQFIIIGIEKQKQNQIGQKINYVLRVRTYVRDYENGKFVFEKFEEDESTWPYEWQGIFRRGSGAERLFIEEIK